MQIQSEIDKQKGGPSEGSILNSSDMLADMRAKPSIGDIDEFLRLELEVGGLSTSKPHESNCESPVNQPSQLVFKKNAKAPFAHEASAIEPLMKNQNVVLDYDGESLADIFQTKLSHQANSSDNPVLLFPEKPDIDVPRTTAPSAPTKTYGVFPYQVKPATQTPGTKPATLTSTSGPSKAGASPGAGNLARKAAAPPSTHLHPKHPATPTNTNHSNNFSSTNTNTNSSKITKPTLSIPKLVSGRNPQSPTLPAHKAKQTVETKALPNKRASDEQPAPASVSAAPGLPDTNSIFATLESVSAADPNTTVLKERAARRPSDTLLNEYGREIKKHVQQEVFKVQSECDTLLQIVSGVRTQLTAALLREQERLLATVADGGRPELQLLHFSVVSKHRDAFRRFVQQEIFPRAHMKITPSFYGLSPSPSKNRLTDLSMETVAKPSVRESQEILAQKPRLSTEVEKTDDATSIIEENHSRDVSAAINQVLKLNLDQGAIPGAISLKSGLTTPFLQTLSQPYTGLNLPDLLSQGMGNSMVFEEETENLSSDQKPKTGAGTQTRLSDLQGWSTRRAESAHDVEQLMKKEKPQTQLNQGIDMKQTAKSQLHKAHSLRPAHADGILISRGKETTLFASASNRKKATLKSGDISSTSQKKFQALKKKPEGGMTSKEPSRQKLEIPDFKKKKASLPSVNGSKAGHQDFAKPRAQKTMKPTFPNGEQSDVHDISAIQKQRSQSPKFPSRILSSIQRKEELQQQQDSFENLFGDVKAPKNGARDSFGQNLFGSLARAKQKLFLTSDQESTVPASKKARESQLGSGTAIRQVKQNSKHGSQSQTLQENSASKEAKRVSKQKKDENSTKKILNQTQASAIFKTQNSEDKMESKQTRNSSISNDKKLLRSKTGASPKEEFRRIFKTNVDSSMATVGQLEDAKSWKSGSVQQAGKQMSPRSNNWHLFSPKYKLLSPEMEQEIEEPDPHHENIYSSLARHRLETLKDKQVTFVKKGVNRNNVSLKDSPVKPDMEARRRSSAAKVETAATPKVKEREKMQLKKQHLASSNSPGKKSNPSLNINGRNLTEVCKMKGRGGKAERSDSGTEYKLQSSCAATDHQLEMASCFEGARPELNSERQSVGFGANQSNSANVLPIPSRLQEASSPNAAEGSNQDQRLKVNKSIGLMESVQEQGGTSKRVAAKSNSGNFEEHLLKALSQKGDFLPLF